MENKDPRTATATQGYLPMDIVLKIIPFLPPRAIARFRCVCKLWRSTIYDADFAEEQYQKASPMLIAPCEDRGDRIDFYDFGPDGKIKINSADRFELRKPTTCNMVRLSNPARGLICGYDSQRSYNKCYHLSNPATRRALRLPGAGPRGPEYQCTLGLGFDAMTACFKLVMLSWNSLTRANSSCLALTVGIDKKWRRIGGLTFIPRTFTEPVFLRGAAHWLALSRDMTDSVVLGFGFEDEKLRRLPTPPVSVPIEHTSMNDLRGRLGVLARHETCFAMWVLKDYAEPAWTREYDIDFSGLSVSISFFHLIGIKDGRVLLQLFDHSSDRCVAHVAAYGLHGRSLKLCGEGPQGYMTLYKGSLVAPGDFTSLDSSSSDCSS